MKPRVSFLLTKDFVTRGLFRGWVYRSLFVYGVAFGRFMHIRLPLYPCGKLSKGTMKVIDDVIVSFSQVRSNNGNSN